MAKTKTSSVVKERYNAKAYDDIRIRVHKGRKEAIQAAASRAGQSINSYVVQAVNERLGREEGSEDNA